MSSPKSPVSAYSFLDLVPKGRNEQGLPWPMAWVRHHDEYGPSGVADNLHEGAKQ
jgi:predicted dithiol-disulfide oxidoreductase (DUF899 family)